MLRPMTPAPMTAVLGCGDAMVEVVISDSLRRAHPTRFSGSDLSRFGPAAHAARPGGTPASRQFWRGALRMQGFSQSAPISRRRPSRFAAAALEKPSTALPQRPLKTVDARL